ncbi:hypothetical protein C4E44_08195 [Pseudomonas sp. MWU12-2312b]|uniref:sacsin N-terminal ATP-binding-like domain-containing protein n=1 Tax=Pseudomonas moorei TaxID=395599 RepID=UPI000D411936|nr:hypothetical protein [Pseudomonas moorei]PPA04622.1 hypothetical protein C4E44_08195 [Pseudomonas sp. MWU12-2312b]
MDEQLGREHAAACFNSASTFNEPTLRTKPYAKAALAEIERLQVDQPEILRKLLKGGNQGAKLLNTDPFQGLREVIQNADDLGATSVHFGIRTIQAQKQLVIVHDGAPVELPHVLPMIYPFYSTKQDSAELKGRFGIGLKTLGQLGADLTIHSPPYHFGARDDHVAMVDEATPIPGLYDPFAQHTMLTVELYAQYDLQTLIEWFDDWAPSDLVFLDHVRTITLQDLDQRDTAKCLSIQLTQAPEAFSLQVGKHPCEVIRSTFLIDGTPWERFVCQVKVAPGKARAAKATSSYTPIGVAIPVDGEAQGRVHVALATKIHTNAAFSLDAQFDPSTSREDMIQGAWNQWLAEASGQFLGALAVHLAQLHSPLAWFVVPVGAKTDSSSDWLNDQFNSHWSTAIGMFKSCPTLIDGQYALSQVSYCDEVIEGLLTEADHLDICGAPMLPEWLRDTNGRWRAVLDSLAVSPELHLSDVLRHCNELGFEQKPPEWFLDIALRCLDVFDDDLLLDTRWVPLADGQRTQAQWDGDADLWLVDRFPDIDLVRRHGLCQTVHPLLLSPAYETVVKWLSENANFLPSFSARHALQAFSNRYANNPLVADDKDLLDLRDLFEHIDSNPKQLGSEVGAALLIGAFHYEGTKDDRPLVTKTLASPGQLYLPASIADSLEPWPKAAATTPGILWASPSYSELFKVSRGTRRSDSNEAKSSNRKLGVKRFLMLLGAETKPRFVHIKTDSSSDLLPAQYDARRYLGKARGGLRQDYISPDLDAVVANLRISPPRLKTRKGRLSRTSKSSRAAIATGGERAVDLFKCIDDNWSSIEPYGKTCAYRESSIRFDSNPVPTTWLARLIDTAWFPNAAGVLCKPSELIVETKVTLAMFEDHTNFARGLIESDANSAFARAMGMVVNPPVSQLVAALDRERTSPSPDSTGTLMRLYKALAGHCPQSTAALAQVTMIGDISVSSLRGRFGVGRTRKGLIAPCVTTTKDRSDWLGPHAVFAGKDIFHARQPFVRADRELMPLWTALNIRNPDLNGCIRELESIAKEGYQPEVDAVLIDIYRHMDRLLEKTTAADRRNLSLLPLRAGGTWSKKRPMYYCDHSNLASDKITLWTPPCAIDTIPRLVEAVGLERLSFASAPKKSDCVTTDEIRFRFQSALKILKNDLARDDEASYKAMEPWSRFDHLTVHLHTEGQLVVDALPKGLRPIPLQVHAHSDTVAFAVHFDHRLFIGRSEFGGTVLARLGNGSRMREIALAWVSAWASSEEHRFTTEISLATETEETNLDALIAEQDRLGHSGRKRIVKRFSEKSTDEENDPTPLQTRRLKALPAEFIFSTDVVDGSQLQSKGRQEKKVAPLLNHPTSTKRPGSPPAPASSYRQYSAEELQQRAWVYVQAALERDEVPLADFQAHRGIGADGAINESTFVEMKSFARGAPSEITLTQAEYRRAKECQNTFYLVIVSGLEEGFETEVRVYINPITNLPWSPKGDVSVGGLAKGAALIMKLNA